jgi:hypothetical protein
MQNQNLKWGIVVVSAVLLLMLAFETTAVHGQAGTGVIRVDGLTGADSDTCGSETTPCKSLQQAVNNVSRYSGATVLVAEGTYIHAGGFFNACEAYLPNGASVLCVFNQQITMLGGYPHGNWTQSDPINHMTIIDGQGQRRGIYAFADPDIYAGSLRLVDVIVQNGFTQGSTDGTAAFGGGLLGDYARIELVRVTFRNNQVRGGNTAQDIGGSGSGGGVALRCIAAGASFEQVTFTGNQAIGGSGAQRGGFGIGGALFTYYTPVSGRYITATNNQSVGGFTGGAGIYQGEGGDAQGAGLALQINTTADLQHVTVMSNTATGGSAPNGTAAGAFGGGIFAEISTVSLRDVVIQNNVAQGGSGLNPASTKFRGSLAEGGGFMADQSNVDLDHATIFANQALAGNGSTTGYGGAAGGGGAYFNSNLSDLKTVSIVNSMVADNYVAMGSGSTDPNMIAGGGGGGISFNYIQPKIQFTTIARNRLNSTSMQGLALAGTPQNGTIYNTIIADHTVPAGMHAVYIQASGSVIMSRTLWAGNSLDVFTGAGSVTNWEKLQAASANFVAPGAPNYNYHIQKSSPAKNMALGNMPSTDYDHQERPWFTAADIGADEYVPLILYGGPIASGQVLLSWQADSSLLPGLSSYEIALSCPVGAACPGPFNAGRAARYVVGGLTNGKTYTVLVTAKNNSNQAIDVSNSIQIIPNDHFVYLPMINR